MHPYPSVVSRLLCLQTHFVSAAAAKSLQLCPTLCDPIDGQLTRLHHPWDSANIFESGRIKYQFPLASPSYHTPQAKKIRPEFSLLQRKFSEVTTTLATSREGAQAEDSCAEPGKNEARSHTTPEAGCCEPVVPSLIRSAGICTNRFKAEHSAPWPGRMAKAKEPSGTKQTMEESAYRKKVRLQEAPAPQP